MAVDLATSPKISMPHVYSVRIAKVVGYKVLACPNTSEITVKVQRVLRYIGGVWTSILDGRLSPLPL